MVKVFCPICSRDQFVENVSCLAQGWPTCCDRVMLSEENMVIFKQTGFLPQQPRPNTQPPVPPPNVQLILDELLYRHGPYELLPATPGKVYVKQKSGGPMGILDEHLWQYHSALPVGVANEVLDRYAEQTLGKK